MQPKPQSRLARKLESAARASKRCLPAHLPPVFYLTDPARSIDPITIAERLPRGWGIIYRHFGEKNRDRVATNLAEIARVRHLVLLVAADPELARSVSAAGVHWPEQYASDARKWRGVFEIMTASAHSSSSAGHFSRWGIDAALRSTVFASVSHSAGQPMGAAAFRREAITAPLPYYALGGIHAQTAGAVAAHAGLASISGIEMAFGTRP